MCMYVCVCVCVFVCVYVFLCLSVCQFVCLSVFHSRFCDTILWKYLTDVYEILHVTSRPFVV